MHKALRIILLVPVVVLILLIGLYLVINSVAVFGAWQNKQEAVDEIETAVPAAQEQVRQVQAAAQGRAGVQDPVWSWIEVSCNWESMAQGWLVSDYAQACRMQAFALAPSSDDLDPACTPDELEISASEEVTTTVVRTSTSELAKEWDGCANEVVLHDSDDPRIVIEGERPTDVSGSEGWVVVRTSKELTRTVIGCHSWSLLFCDTPGEVALPGS